MKALADFPMPRQPRGVARTVASAQVTDGAVMKRAIGHNALPMLDPFLLLLDLRLPPGGSATLPLPAGYNALVYVYAGNLTVAATENNAPVSLTSGVAGVLGNGDGMHLRTGAGAGLLLVAALPLEEPVARHGPFVMNNQRQLAQAFEDYRSGTFL